MRDLNSFNDALGKLFANPLGDLQVDDYPGIRIPIPGDHVKIVNWEGHCNANKCVTLSKLPYLVVESVFPRAEGNDSIGYHWVYDICVEEEGFDFLYGDYKLL